MPVQIHCANQKTIHPSSGSLRRQVKGLRGQEAWSCSPTDGPLLVRKDVLSLLMRALILWRCIDCWVSKSFAIHFHVTRISAIPSFLKCIFKLRICICRTDTLTLIPMYCIYSSRQHRPTAIPEQRMSANPSRYCRFGVLYILLPLLTTTYPLKISLDF